MKIRGPLLRAITFYNIDNVSPKEKLIICEGPFDVWSLYQNGDTNTVSLLGSSFSSEHKEVLKSWRQNIYFALDNDETGINKTITLLLNNSSIRNKSFVVIYDENDPHDYVQSHYGKSITSNSVEANKYLIDYILNNYPRESIKDRNEVLKLLFSIIYEQDKFGDKYLKIIQVKFKLDMNVVLHKYRDYVINKSNLNNIKNNRIIHVIRDIHYLEVGNSFYLMQISKDKNDDCIRLNLNRYRNESINDFIEKK